MADLDRRAPETNMKADPDPDTSPRTNLVVSAAGKANIAHLAAARLIRRASARVAVIINPSVADQRIPRVSAEAEANVSHSAADRLMHRDLAVSAEAEANASPLAAVRLVRPDLAARKQDIRLSEEALQQFSKRRGKHQTTVGRRIRRRQLRIRHRKLRIRAVHRIIDASRENDVLREVRGK
jgi:hypothetical protein